MSHKILIVDDDETILDVLQLLLEGEGYQVAAAAKMWDQRKLLEYHPDLILLDIMLSGESGIEICKALKGQADTNAIPVILISAYANFRTPAHSSGADDFVAKPFDVDHLISVVEKHLSA